MLLVFIVDCLICNPKTATVLVLHTYTEAKVLLLSQNGSESITIVQSYTGKDHEFVAVCIVTSVQHKEQCQRQQTSDFFFLV